ncbi:MAG: hypothetical protein ABIU97_03915, partial [Dehalococcoidia bacterium]
MPRFRAQEGFGIEPQAGLTAVQDPPHIAAEDYSYSNLAAVAQAPSHELAPPLHLPDIPSILTGRRQMVIRALECLPLALALLLISSLVWGPLFVPMGFTIVILAFHAWWLWRAFMNGSHGVKGYC